MATHNVSEGIKLYRQGDYRDAIVVFSEIKRTNEKLFLEAGLNSYLWCLYKNYLAKKSEFTSDDRIVAISTLSEIISLSTSDTLIYQVSIIHVASALMKDKEYDRKHILRWLQLLEPMDLSTTCAHIQDKELVSLRERWYLLVTKAAYELKDYGLCIEVGEKAVSDSEFTNFKNDVWIKRYLALSESALGNQTLAIRLYQDILKKKRDWFLQQELGDCYKKSGESQKALTIYLQAYTAPGPDSYKIGLIQNVAELVHSSNNELSELCARYVIKIRLKNGWHLNTKQMMTYDFCKDSIDKKSISQYKEDIEKEINQYLWPENTAISGCVASMLPNKKAGFIRTKDKSYYFSVKDVLSGKLVIVGDSVRFHLGEGYDHKKQQTTKIAVRVEKL